MKCVEVKQQLNFLTDGEIDFSQKEIIERHLQDCLSCRNAFERLQFVSAVLKQPVSAPTNLDARVLDAFQKHHAHKKPVPVLTEKRRFFGRIFIPVPIFALGLILFALAVGAAYRLGKNSGEQTVIADNKDSEISDQSSKNTNQTAQTLVKYVEVPITKVVKIPIVKEKQITRMVYRDKNDAKVFSPIDKRSFETEAKASKQVLTEFDLKGFQTVSELKPVIIKDGKNQ